jgi:hypothetical protein
VGQNPTQKQLERFKKKNRDRTTLPRYLIEELLKKLGETADTSGMDGLGLTARISRIRNFNKMQEWKKTVEEYLNSIPENLTTTSNATEISTTASSRNSGSTATSIKQGDERDPDDDYRVFTTTLRQIIRDDHNLNDIEKPLVFEQVVNHQVFKAFCRVIQEVTDMVRH